MLNTIMDMTQYWLLVAAVIGLLLMAEKDWKKWTRVAHSKMIQKRLLPLRAPVKAGG